MADAVPAVASRPIRLLLSFLTVGGWTMASRVLGFVRDVMIAAFLGAGPVAEAFFVAFRLPNMFRRFFAEGAFNMAFVPMFAKKVEGDGEDAARAFGREAQAVLLAALVALTVVAEIAMPWFVLALASGFDGPTFELAVLFSRIGFPYILFISLTALYSGVLNSFGRFAAAAAAPTLLNIALIGAMLLAWWLDLNMGLTLAWSELIAGIAQLGLVLWAAKRIGMALGLQWPRLTPQVRRLVRIGIPAVLAGGVVQINLVVGTQVASYFDGAVAWLSYADRLYQLPLGVVGVAIGVVLLPELSRRFRTGDTVGMREALNRATEFTLILTIPAAVSLVAIPELICRVLYQRGAFDAVDTANTALALAVYAVGLPAFTMQKVLQPAFFAREDTMTPLRYAAVSMLVNVGVAVGLAPVIGFVSAALGTTLAGWVNLALLWRGVRRLGGLDADPRLRRRLPRIALASALMGVLTLAIAWAAARWQPELPGLALAAVVVLGMATYAFLSLAIGAFALSDIRAAMRRSRS
ncbi:MAG TPA: murein biosynthesis integral membrane protein MurJ [Paracoccaceae bacterium]|nr:murein biosynthesis integral membrane protein MurJ [Paracoccaceae bacterium]